MSEEMFYNRVKESLANYAPEVPAQVYGSMRRRLWWSRFTKLDMGRFNAWYLLLGIGLASGLAFSTAAPESSDSALRGGSYDATCPSVSAAAPVSCAPAACSPATTTASATTHNRTRPAVEPVTAGIIETPVQPASPETMLPQPEEVVSAEEAAPAMETLEEEAVPVTKTKKRSRTLNTPVLEDKQ